MGRSAKWIQGGVARSPLDWAQILMRIVLAIGGAKASNVLIVFLVRSTFFLYVRLPGPGMGPWLLRQVFIGLGVWSTC